MEVNFVFWKKISNEASLNNKIIEYGCEYLEHCLYSCFDSFSKKMILIFDIVENSKTSRLQQAKIVYKGPISTQIYSAIRLNRETFNS